MTPQRWLLLVIALATVGFAGYHFRDLLTGTDRENEVRRTALVNCPRRVITDDATICVPANFAVAPSGGEFTVAPGPEVKTGTGFVLKGRDPASLFRVKLTMTPEPTHPEFVEAMKNGDDVARNRALVDATKTVTEQAGLDFDVAQVDPSAAPTRAVVISTQAPNGRPAKRVIREDGRSYLLVETYRERDRLAAPTLLGNALRAIFSGWVWND